MKPVRYMEVLTAVGFAKRANEARRLFDLLGGPVPSQAWIAKRASTFLDGDEVGQSVVTRWFSGESIPDTPLRAWAFARALRVDPGWLIFGTESSAPAPVGSVGAGEELGPEEMLEPEEAPVPKRRRRRA